MEDILKQNIELINRLYPEYITHIQNIDDTPYSVGKSKSGQLTLFCNKVPVHSHYDPVKEARYFTNYPDKHSHSVIIVLGMGLGYHVERLLNDKSITAKFIIIFEASSSVFSISAQYRKYSFLSDPRVIFNLGSKLSYKTLVLLHSLDFKSLQGVKLLNYKPITRLDEKKYSILQTNIQKELQLSYQNQLTRLELSSSWLKNIIKNLPIACTCYNIANFKAVLVNSPALIISAGPSLSNSLRDIKKCQSMFTIFVVDTALKVVLDYGIIPDFVVSLDAQFHNLKDFYYIEHVKQFEQSTLIFDLSVYHKIARLPYKSKICFASSQQENQTEYPILNYLQNNYNWNVGKIVAGSSVTISAIDIANFLGCSPIGLIGLDMSYSNGCTHCNGTHQYNDVILLSDKINTFYTRSFKRISAKKNVIEKNEKNEKNRDKICITDVVLKSTRDWLEQYARLENLPLTNCTTDGLVIKGIPHKHLAELCNNISQNDKKYLSLTSNKQFFLTATLIEFLKSFIITLDEVINYLVNNNIQSKEEVIKQFSKITNQFPFLNQIIDNLEYKFTLVYRKDINVELKLFCQILIALLQTLKSASQKSLNQCLVYY